ncbi:MAG: hypothetical protein QW774_01495 [Candidatus Micrarchaeaceae archaeon]
MAYEIIKVNDAQLPRISAKNDKFRFTGEVIINAEGKSSIE